MAARLSEMEREFIIENYAQLGATETARRVGCDRRTAQRIWAESGKEKAVRREPAANPEPQTKLERLIELRGILRAAMNDAPPQAISGLAREYRETIDEINRMEGGNDGDPVSSALDSIAARIAAKMPAP